MKYAAQFFRNILKIYVIKSYKYLQTGRRQCKNLTLTILLKNLYRARPTISVILGNRNLA